MDVVKTNPGIRRPGRDNGSSKLEARLRAALDMALIVAMAAAPFLLVDSQQDDAQFGADTEMSPMQLTQLSAP